MGALRYNEHRMTRIALLVVFRGLVSPGWGQRVPIAWERVAGGSRTPVQVTGAAAGSARWPSYGRQPWGHQSLQSRVPRQTQNIVHPVALTPMFLLAVKG